MIVAAPPAVALSVSPARVALVAPAARVVEIHNVGAERLAVEVRRESVDGRGPAKGLLRIRPAHLVLRPGSSGVVTLRAGAERRAGLGDHQLRLLLVARPQTGGRIAVRLRLGVRVRIRIPGRTVRRIEIRGLRVRRRSGAPVLLVSVANTGNVTEQLRGQLTVTLTRGGHFVSRLRPRTARELFPGTHASVALRYVGRVRGLATALVKVRLSPAARPLERRYRIRL